MEILRWGLKKEMGGGGGEKAGAEQHDKSAAQEQGDGKNSTE